MMMMTMMTYTIPYRRTKNHIWDKVLMGIWVHPVIVVLLITVVVFIFFDIFVTIFSSIANVLTDQHRQQTTFVNRNDLVIHIFFCQQCYTHNMNMKSKILLQHGLPKNFFGLFCHESWWWLILYTVQRQMGQLFCHSPATEPLLHLSPSIFINQWKPLVGLNQMSMFDNEGLLTPSAGIA